MLSIGFPLPDQELNRLVTEKLLGVSLVPPRNIALSVVARRHHGKEGRFAWTTDLGEVVKLPPQDELPTDPELADVTDRQFAWIAQEFWLRHPDKRVREQFEAEVLAYRMEPMDFCNDATWRDIMAGHIVRSGFQVTQRIGLNSNSEVYHTATIEASFAPDNFWTAAERSAGRALCVAALMAIGVIGEPDNTPDGFHGVVEDDVAGIVAPGQHH